MNRVTNPELVRDQIAWALEEAHRHEPQYPLWYGPLDFWRAWSWRRRLAVVAAGVLAAVIGLVLAIGFLLW